MDTTRLGRRIKAFRKLKGYTQVEFAQKLEIPIITLGKIERGQKEASAALINEIVDTLAISKEELVLEDEKPKEK